jgi:hypothetical protein
MGCGNVRILRARHPEVDADLPRPLPHFDEFAADRRGALCLASTCRRALRRDGHPAASCAHYAASCAHYWRPIEQEFEPGRARERSRGKALRERRVPDRGRGARALSAPVSPFAVRQPEGAAVDRAQQTALEPGRADRGVHVETAEGEIIVRRSAISTAGRRRRNPPSLVRHQETVGASMFPGCPSVDCNNARLLKAADRGSVATACSSSAAHPRRSVVEASSGRQGMSNCSWSSSRCATRRESETCSLDGRARRRCGVIGRSIDIGVPRYVAHGSRGRVPPIATLK